MPVQKTAPTNGNQRAIDDPVVKAIVLDVNSPGGAVSGTDELSSTIFNAWGKKPIIAHVNSSAASAAYWIASAGDEIVVTPTGQVGSIGVVAVHDNLSAMLKAEGVNRTVIAAGKYKTESSPFAPLGDTAKAELQRRVDHAYGMFIARIAKNRGVTQTAVRDGFGQGRMVTARNAVKQNMADKVGTLDDLLIRLGVPVAPHMSSTANLVFLEREKRALFMKTGKEYGHR